MLTARALTVSDSMLTGGGGLLPGGLLWGGDLLWGGVCSGGVSAPGEGGVCCQGGVSALIVYPLPPLLTESQTPVKT